MANLTQAIVHRPHDSPCIAQLMRGTLRSHLNNPAYGPRSGGERARSVVCASQIGTAHVVRSLRS